MDPRSGVASGLRNRSRHALGGFGNAQARASSMKKPAPLLNWEVIPAEGARAGVSMFVVLHGAKGSDSHTKYSAKITSLDSSVGIGDGIEIPLERMPSGEWRKEFTLSLPGDYVVHLGDEMRTVHVDAQEYLSFGREFGLFSGSVLILVGGMLLWLWKSKIKLGV